MATINTNLISVVQDAIDNRTSTASPQELVALRALAEKLLMTNQSGLDVEVQANIDALTNTSSIPDIIRAGMAATFKSKSIDAGSLGKFLPVNVCRASDLLLKTYLSTTVASHASGFRINGIENQSAKQNGQFLTYSKTDTLNNNLEQQIVNIPVGKGVLTHIVTPECTTASTIRVRIVADGEEYIFEVDDSPTDARLCIGGFLDEQASKNGSATGSGIGSYWDVGFGGNIKLLIKPNQVLQKGIGLTFENSLEVYFQCVSGSVNVNTEYKNAYVLVAKNTPLGFEK